MQRDLIAWGCRIWKRGPRSVWPVHQIHRGGPIRRVLQRYSFQDAETAILFRLSPPGVQPLQEEVLPALVLDPGHLPDLRISAVGDRSD